MGILIVWGVVVIGAGGLLAAWLLGLPVELRNDRGFDPALLALVLLALGVVADSLIRLRARWRR